MQLRELPEPLFNLAGIEVARLLSLLPSSLQAKGGHTAPGALFGSQAHASSAPSTPEWVNLGK